MIKRIFYGWWIVLACFFINLYVGGIIFFGFTAFFEPLIKEFGWSYTQISFAASLRGLEMGIFAPMIGFLVDRFGSRKMILSGTIIVGFGLLLLSVTRSLVTFYCSFLLLALGAGGCTSVVTMTAIAIWFNKNIGRALGVVTCGFGASGLMVPLIVWLIDTYHWRTTLIVLGLGMWILGIPLSFIVRDKPEQYGYLPDGELLQDPKPHQIVRDKETEIGVREAIRQKPFLYLMLVDVIRLIINTAVIIHLMPYFNSAGLPRFIGGTVAAAIPLFSILGRFGFGWFGDLYDKKRMMTIVLLLMGGGMVAFCCVQQIWAIIIFIFLFSSGMGGCLVLIRAIMREHFGRQSFGKILGIIMGFASFGGIIGPTFAGWVFDTMRSYHMAWFVFLGLIIIAIILMSRIKLKD